VERKAKLCQLAHSSSGDAGLQQLEGSEATPEAVLEALNAMSFAVGHRYIVVDGVETWSAKQAKPVAEALTDLQEDLTVAFFAREAGRRKVAKALSSAVTAAGGVVSVESKVKPWDLPKWLVGQAAVNGVKLNTATAQLIVDRVGDSQQRLLREVEKIKLFYSDSSATVDSAQVQQLLAKSSQQKAWALADPVIAKNSEESLERLLDLYSQGESTSSLLYVLVGRVKLALEVMERLRSGESEGEVRASLRMPPKASTAFIASVKRFKQSELRQLFNSLTQVELSVRGVAETSTDSDLSAPFGRISTSETALTRSLLSSAE